MKAIKLLGLSLGWLLLTAASAKADRVGFRYPHLVNRTQVEVTLVPEGKPPEWMAVLVQMGDPMDGWQKKRDAAMAKWREERATNPNARPILMPWPEHNFNFAKAQWLPFKTNLLVDLGPGAGKRQLMFGFRYPGQQPADNWSGSDILVQTNRPVIVITDPKAGIISQPLIQLQGTISTETDGPLDYQIFNERGGLTASGQGLINDTHLDLDANIFTTSYFTCYDLRLNPGTNTIIITGADKAGFSFTNTFVSVFTTVGDMNPPVFAIDSPQPGSVVAGDSLTIHGPCDDPTAKMAGFISANGKTNELEAVIERDGHFWFQNVPLAEGSNNVTLTETDVAGNSSGTNFVIFGSNEVRISVDPLADPSQLWDANISVVTGKVQPANRDVWVNGVQATVKPDGTWMAKKIPVASSPNGNVALFNFQAVTRNDVAVAGNKLNEKLSAQAGLGADTVVLNPSVPACGVFQLHLTETDGRSFILEASTNLVAWSPILTNTLSNPTFDYTDTNAGNFPCRFFRVVPLP